MSNFSKRTQFFLIFLILFLFNFILLNNLFSKEIKKQIVMHGGYTFETYDGQKNSAVYLSIFNNSVNDVVIKSVSTNVANISEFHKTYYKNNIVSMKKLDFLTLKSEDVLYLQPGNTHIMLMGLKKKLVDQESFELIFSLENEETIIATIKILNKSLNKKNINHHHSDF